ncbi:MAG: DUF4870 domain-containing protein [Chloroflexi bacterium]|nr:DUF4870 domain-containing protein [Chloroflexota bacterium]
MNEINDNDKLIAALSYPIWFVALVPLLTEGKNRPFQKFHAVQSLVLNIALWIAITILICVLSFVMGAVTFFVAGLGAICGFCPLLLWFVTIYYAYLAYQGQYFEIPVITDFIVNQGWVERP